MKEVIFPVCFPPVSVSWTEWVVEHCSGIKTPRRSPSLLTRKGPCELKNVGSSHILFLEFFFPCPAQGQTQSLRSGTATSVWAFKAPKGKEREKEWKEGRKEGRNEGSKEEGRKGMRKEREKRERKEKKDRKYKKGRRKKERKEMSCLTSDLEVQTSDLWYWHTDRNIDQWQWNRKPRDKFMHLWTPCLWQRRQKYTMEKRQSV